MAVDQEQWPSDPLVQREARRRRTFAIIAHPDAGKTTLTEKLLLYGGQLEVAGMVRGRKTNRVVTSDWMELERQRGISITSTVLTFEYRGHLLNLLDTPGHQDFSEDTYRTLYAADCAVMVLDFAKGVEAQTEKLFRVCALRGIPVLTFVNKVDRYGRDPFELLDEIESKFGMHAVPFNWPIGSGQEFRGLYDRRAKAAVLYEDHRGGDRVVGFRTVPLEDVSAAEVGETELARLRSGLELLSGAGTRFATDEFLQGRQTPVFFGSALHNFGIGNFLDHFLTVSPSPSTRASDRGDVPADRAEFSGFVFKIQANLDPRHRDRVAFVRVCSGRFERDMEVTHVRTGRRLKVRRCHRVFAAERETMDEAYPGDILGLVNPGRLHLGDTLCIGEPLNYEPLPQFPPERFAEFRCTETRRRKQFAAGIQQLAEEGAVQLFYPSATQTGEPILAAIGELQFDVVKYRLETEYNTQVAVSPLPYEIARWIHNPPASLDSLRLDRDSRLVVDAHLQPVALFRSEWSANFYAKENPLVEFRTVSSNGRFYDTRRALE
jgi:peptide chain release factor 3